MIAPVRDDVGFVTSDERDDVIYRVELDVEEEEPDPTAPFDCPRCGEATPRDRTLCVWCGQALEPDAADKAERLEDLIVESLVEATGDDAEKLLDFRDTERDNPRVRAEAIEEIADILERH